MLRVDQKGKKAKLFASFKQISFCGFLCMSSRQKWRGFFRTDQKHLRWTKIFGIFPPNLTSWQNLHPKVFSMKLEICGQILRLETAVQINILQLSRVLLGCQFHNIPSTL